MDINSAINKVDEKLKTKAVNPDTFTDWGKEDLAKAKKYLENLMKAAQEKGELVVSDELEKLIESPEITDKAAYKIREAAHNMLPTNEHKKQVNVDSENGNINIEAKPKKQMGGEHTNNINLCICFSGNKKIVASNIGDRQTATDNSETNPNGSNDTVSQNNTGNVQDGNGNNGAKPKHKSKAKLKSKLDKVDKIFCGICVCAIIAGAIMLVIYFACIDPRGEYEQAILFQVLAGTIIGADVICIVIELVFSPLLKEHKFFRKIAEIVIIFVVIGAIVWAAILMSRAANTNNSLLHMAATAPTCTKDGNKEYWYNKDEDKYFSDENGENEISEEEVFIPAKGHQLTPVAEKSATCTEEGNIAYYMCNNSNCGKYFSDKNGKDEITSASVITPKIQHDFSVEKAEDTYLKSKATCTTKAVYYKSCSNCGAKSETETFKYGELVAHKLIHFDANEATCTKEGNIAYYSCTVCKKSFADENSEIIITNSIVEKIEHNYKNGVCDVCGYLQAYDLLTFSLSADKTCYSITGNDITDETQIIIPSTYIDLPVTSIGYGAFYGCSNLTDITIPDSVLEIGQSAFAHCGGLISITVPFIGATENESNTPFAYFFGGQSIYDNAKCIPISLKTVTITGGTSIKYEVFHGCSSLVSVVIGSGVISIDTYAFMDCVNLTSLSISNGLTTINSGAFYGCSNLTDITIPDSVIEIGAGAFYGCNKLIKKIDGISYVNNWVVECDSSVVVANLEENIKGIADYAFYNCNSLERVFIPKSIKFIGIYAFGNCTHLTEAEFEYVENWYYWKTTTNSEYIQKANLSSATVAAVCLKSTYYKFRWECLNT